MNPVYRLKRPALKSLAAEIKNSIIVNKTSKVIVFLANTSGAYTAYILYYFPISLLLRRVW